MKSVVITFLMFFVIFSLLKMNIIGLFSSSVFHIISYLCLGLVLVCAAFFVGLPLRTKDVSQPKEEQDNVEE